MARFVSTCLNEVGPCLQASNEACWPLGCVGPHSAKAIGSTQNRRVLVPVQGGVRLCTAKSDSWSASDVGLKPRLFAPAVEPSCWKTQGAISILLVGYRRCCLVSSFCRGCVSLVRRTSTPRSSKLGPSSQAHRLVWKLLDALPYYHYADVISVFSGLTNCGDVGVRPC